MTEGVILAALLAVPLFLVFALAAMLATGVAMLLEIALTLIAVLIASPFVGTRWFDDLVLGRVHE